LVWKASKRARSGVEAKEEEEEEEEMGMEREEEGGNGRSPSPSPPALLILGSWLVWSAGRQCTPVNVCCQLQE
jgi:hypothetical protein